MATWTTIPDSSIEPGKPIRSIDGIALRDNPIAIAEGASGAPRVQTDGIQDSAVTTAKIADGNVTAAKLATGNNERDWVLARTAAATHGAVGTYAFLRPDNNTAYAPGSTLAGSSLRYSGALRLVETGAGTTQSASDDATPAGTWRCMGNRSGGGGTLNSSTSTLWLRIS